MPICNVTDIQRTLEQRTPNPTFHWPSRADKNAESVELFDKIWGIVDVSRPVRPLPAHRDGVPVPTPLSQHHHWAPHHRASAETAAGDEIWGISAL